MTRTTTSSPASRPASAGRRRLLSASVAAVLAALLAVPSTATAADSRSSSSERLAAAAQDTIETLDRWRASGSASHFAAYNAARNAVAAATAEALGTSARDLAAAWSRVDVTKQHVILAAISQLGVPYRSMASIEGKGFDCSGLLLYAFGEAGIELPRSSRDQYRAGSPVGTLAAEPGDLVYYPGHISIYLGDGLIVHSPQSGQDVEVRTVFERSLQFADVVAELADTASAGGAQRASDRD
jgi:cell wall-associated NlpC family hydrolase